MQNLKSLLLIAGASLPLALGGAAHARKYQINTRAKKSSMKEFTVDPNLKPALTTDGKAFKKDSASIKINRDLFGNALFEAYKDAQQAGGNPGQQRAHHVWAHIN